MLGAIEMGQGEEHVMYYTYHILHPKRLEKQGISFLPF